MADNKVTIEILVKNEQAKTAIKQINKNLADFESKTKQNSKKAGSALKLVSSDVGVLSKTARKFSQDWGVSFKSAYAHTKKMGVGMKNVANDVEKGGKKMSVNLTLIAWHFRYLGSAFTKMSQQWFRLSKQFIETAADLEESFFSIRASAALYGQSAEEATEFTKELARTGLVPLSDAADAVRNLLMTGIGMPELEKFSYRYIDVASLTTSGMKQMEKSLTLMTQSILRGTLVLATDVTARKIWTETNKRLENTVGKSLKQLDAQQRAIEVLKTIETDYAATLNLHKVEADKMAATQGRIKTALQETSQVLGNSLRPALEVVATFLVWFSTKVEGAVQSMGALFPIINFLGIAFTALIGVVFSTAGIMWSVVRIGRVLKGVLSSLSITNIKAAVAWVAHAWAARTATVAVLGFKIVTWQLWVVMGAVAAAIAGVTWLVMKLTGSFDKSTDAITSESKELVEMRQGFEEIDGEVVHFNNTLQETIDRISELESEISTKRSGYERDLARLVLKHSDSWKKASDDVKGATEKMKSSIAELTKSHEQSIKDEELAYRRKREDIEEELEREVSKGLWADQMKIAELKKTLKRTEEDHKIAFKKEDERYKDRKKSVMETYKDELDAAKESMEEISKLWMKHQDEVREGLELMKLLPDEFEEIKESFVKNTKEESEELDGLKAKMSSFEERLKDFGVLAKNIASTLFQVYKNPIDALGILEDRLPKIKSDFLNFLGLVRKETSEMNDEFEMTKENIEGIQDIFAPTMGYSNAPYSQTTPSVWPGLNFKTGGIVPGAKNEEVPILAHGGERIIPSREVNNELMTVPKVWPSFQTGGIVPGTKNQPVPILAHGGEKVIPSGEVGNESITININNPSVRSENDIQGIARAVSRVLGQRQKFARLGAF